VASPRKPGAGGADRRRSALLAIAELIAPEETEVGDAVALAYDDPAAYVKRRAKQLGERGIVRPMKELPWIALVDELERVKRLASVDWKTSTEDLVWSLGKLVSLPKRAGRWAWAKRREDLDERDLVEVLEIVGERLAKEERLQLAHLDTGADEYELVVVDVTRAKRLVELGKRAGYGDVDLFTGSDLAGFEKERVEKAEAAARQVQADPSRQRNFVHPDGRVWITLGSAWWPTDDPEQHFALYTHAGTLGSSTHSRDPEKQIIRGATEFRRVQEAAIAAHLADGFAELDTPDYAKKENAAQRARKRKNK
jgi:hypothetical protein